MSDSVDPVRLVEPGSEAPARLRELFEAARTDLPGPAELARMRARLPEASGAPGGPGPTTGAGLLGKVVIGAGALAGLGALLAGLFIAQGAEAPPEVESTSPPVATTAPEAAPSPAEPSPPVAPTEPEVAAPEQPEPEQRARRAPSAVAPQRAPATSEAALLERARRALSTAPRTALALTEEHRQKFPQGVLTQEREVIAIEALRRLGRGGEASDRAGDFQKEFPDSPHRARVERDAGP